MRVAVVGPRPPRARQYEGDGGKPYKPCKSMCRVIVSAWGADTSKYIGRSLTLYCDPKVKWGGMEVGGIRISHMSHMDKPQTMALTATRSKRAPFTVQPLSVSVSKAQEMIKAYSATAVKSAWDALEVLRGQEWSKLAKDEKELDEAVKDDWDNENYNPWFSEDKDEQKAAKAICRNCEVLKDCREWERENPQAHGIWWGQTTGARQRLAKRRKA